AASVRPEPGSNSPNKTTCQRNLTKQKTTPTHGDAQAWQKQKQQTKTTKHTIEFSNNTPGRAPNQPAALGRVLVERTARSPPKWISLWDAFALDGQAASRRLHQVTRGTSRSQTTC